MYLCSGAQHFQACVQEWYGWLSHKYVWVYCSSIFSFLRTYCWFLWCYTRPHFKQQRTGTPLSLQPLQHLSSFVFLTSDGGHSNQDDVDLKAALIRISLMIEGCWTLLSPYWLSVHFPWLAFPWWVKDVEHLLSPYWLSVHLLLRIISSVHQPIHWLDDLSFWCLIFACFKKAFRFTFRFLKIVCEWVFCL